MNLYARRQSLQEAKRSPEQVVSDTKAEIKSLKDKCAVVPAYFNMLVAIRTDNINNLPAADQYLNHFISVGWSIESLVVLGYSESAHQKYYKFGIPLCEFSQAPNLAEKKAKGTHHLLLAPIRNHFGWA